MREHGVNELVTVVTRKGQVTIPVEVRRSLGLKQGDKVAFVVEGQKAELVRAGSVVDRTKGALKSKAKALSAEELRRAAEEAVTEEAVERSSP